MVSPCFSLFIREHSFLCDEVRFAQCNQGDARKRLENFLLRISEGFHELKDTNFLSRTDSADGETDSGSGLALSIACIYMDISFGHDGCLLFLLHKMMGFLHKKIFLLLWKKRCFA